uniref:RNA-directed DNA polymerase from mobile element jockey-like n=1 Tax=Hirondellea gigas TaxID=1518452 RepID=A0A2P2I074_9CRUS
MKAVHSLGIRGNMALYIKNFLSDRSFRTRVANTLSDVHIQEECVPQGSVISRTLFLIAINNITSNLPPYVKSILYVDNLVLYTSSSRAAAMERRLQMAIERTAEWCTKNGFTFSQTKTVAVRFYRGKNPHDLRLLLYGQLITPKESTSYLGIIFDNRLEWNHHIASVKEDCMKKMNILKNISRKTRGFDRITLLRLYRALIIPKLDYGCEAYASAKDRTLAKLDPVHNCVIRLHRCFQVFSRSKPLHREW